MPFVKTLPEWNAAGIEPPQSLKDVGWKAGMKPPDAYFNWYMYNTYQALLELQQKAIHTEKVGQASGIAALDANTLVPLAQLPTATVSARGVVQLTSATNSTSTALAATASAVKAAYDLAASKAGTAIATTSANGLMSSTDKGKLDGIASGAEVNQNAFSNVKVGTAILAADSKTDTLELVAGTNVVLTPDAATDKVTIGLSSDIETTAGAKAQIDAAIAALIEGAPGALDTLNELAAAMGDDPDFATTVINRIATAEQKSTETEQKVTTHLADNTNPHKVTTTQVNYLGSYTKKATDGHDAYPLGISVVFVGPTEQYGGWGFYGTVVTSKSYTAGGGTFQTYTPYGEGAGSLGAGEYRVRFWVYGQNIWSEWKVFETKDRLDLHLADNVSHATYATNTSVNDSYAITDSDITDYTAGMIVNFKATIANTTGCTLNINGLGAKNIYKNVSAALETGDIIANQIVSVIYDGTNFQLLSPPGSSTTAQSVQTLSNKTLTAPKIANGGFIADPSGNEQIKFSQTTSAVNEFTFKNAATGGAPELQASGGDTNIDINLVPKGSGKLKATGKEVALQETLDSHKADYITHTGYAAATGTANAYTATLTPALSAYAEGVSLRLKINVDNTGASTVNVNGLGAKAIKKTGGADVPAGYLKAGSVYTLAYDGVNFQLQGEGSDLSDADVTNMVTSINNILGM